MNRQPTLAEILSDDTGRIRAEVADLLMEPHARRRPPARQGGQQPGYRPFPAGGLVALGMIALMVYFVIAGISGSNPGRANKVETVPTEVVLEPAAAPVSAPEVQAKEQDQAIEDSRTESTEEIESSVRPAEETPYWTGKTGHIIANRTPILTGPANWGGDVIRTANRGESFPVFSFNDGWYKVALPNEALGYVFGAFFVSHDLDIFPYRTARLRDRDIWLLVKEIGSEHYLQVVLPNGDSSQCINRDEVLLNIDVD